MFSKLTTCILFCLFSISAFSQMTIKSNFVSLNSAPFEIERLNNPELYGSHLTSQNTSATPFGSISLSQMLSNKIGFKIGLGTGYFEHSISYYASPEFINFSSPQGTIPSEIIITRNLVQRNTHFGELTYGFLIPFRLADQHHLNISLSGKSTLVFSSGDLFGPERPDDILREISIINTGTPNSIPIVVGAVDDSASKKLLWGFESEVNYQYTFNKIPLGIHLGAIVSHTPKAYIVGYIDLIGEQETLNTNIFHKVSYFGLTVGLSYLI